MAKRLMIQEAFLLFLSAAGYGMYLLVQRPVLLNGEEKGREQQCCHISYISGRSFCKFALLGAAFSCSLLPVSEYVGRDRKLPPFMDCN